MEIDTVLGSPSQRQGIELPLPDYATAFPKLMRCLAVMVSHNYFAYSVRKCYESAPITFSDMATWKLTFKPSSKPSVSSRLLPY
jgi:hypothetical protein